MMTSEFLPAILTIAGMHMLMAMLPGPNTLVVSWLSATRSRRDGLRAAGGVAVASLLWAVLALGGVGALLLEAGWLYRMLRLAGAAYLVFVGVRMIAAAWQRLSDGPPSPLRTEGRGPFAMGVATTLSNPKSAVFWTSAFLVAVPPHAPAWVSVAVLVVIGVQSALWYGTVACFFSTGPARALYTRLSRRLDAVAGCIMVLLGLRLGDEVRRELSAAA